LSSKGNALEQRAGANLYGPTPIELNECKEPVFYSMPIISPSQ
jgi:hypothetical protein